MRKLILVSIAMNTLLLIGVVALAIQAGSIPKGDTGASATKEQLIEAAKAVAPTTEAVAEKVLPHVEKAKISAENSSKSAEKVDVDVKILTGEIKKVRDEIKASADLAEIVKKAAEEAKKANEASKIHANDAKNAATKTADSLKDSENKFLELARDLIVPNVTKANEYTAAKVEGIFEPKILNKGTLRIELSQDVGTTKLTYHLNKPRKKVILLEHVDNSKTSRCICKTSEATFIDDNTMPKRIKINVPVTFFDTVENTTKDKTIIVMFGSSDESNWMYSKIIITPKP